ncbi:ATP-dependent DNA helicase MER3 [Halocaridina rubra]|uniref:ATP-dependent DNA helicase MER3 n=1 Tax=Halocaridina rubra TaxID=373956 RepID=A0AAN9AHG1_HALRR
MKAIVSERFLEWDKRLGPLGVTCAEITGDTEHDDISVIKHSQIVLTTPEKWDSLTRRWRDHASLMQAVALLLIDEVHMLTEADRGPTLEAVVSRMKTIRSTRPSDTNVSLRFIAVSATIPNVDDVAAWLSDREGPAVARKLEETLRPVKLRRVVLGYDCRENWSEFRFEISLNYKLPSVIATYSSNKPTLVFVATRKSAQTTATTLSQQARLVRNAEHKQCLTTVGNCLRDNKLRG